MTLTRMPGIRQSGQRQREMLKHQKGESDLVYHRGEFYLLATCEVPEEPLSAVDEFLDVDRGVVNVATDNDGYSYTKQRRGLQKTGTKGLNARKVGSKQARFQTDVNHCIA